jgi:biopolymer transport protein TolQ
MEPHALTDVAITSAAAADYSIISLFMRADVVVKAVMAGLALASIWSWAIIFDKGFKLGGLKGRAARFEDLFWSGKPLDELYKRVEAKPDHPLAVVFIAAMREWRRSMEKRAELGSPSSLVARINTVMQASIAREVSNLQKNMNFLATLASTAPFVGLFGTVWGIMNAFERIGITQSTSLAVVAPAIAEALMATGLGLAAAIPALIFYNRYSATINEYAIRLDGFADEFSAILSRQLEERRG